MVTVNQLKTWSLIFYFVKYSVRNKSYVLHPQEAYILLQCRKRYNSKQCIFLFSKTSNKESIFLTKNLSVTNIDWHTWVWVYITMGIADDFSRTSIWISCPCCNLSEVLHCFQGKLQRIIKWPSLEHYLILAQFPFQCPLFLYSGSVGMLLSLIALSPLPNSVLLPYWLACILQNSF